MLNREQIKQLLQVLLAAGGPVAGLLTQYGMDATKVNAWLSIALIVLPPLGALIWGIVDKTDKRVVTAAGAMPGVSVMVATGAPEGAKAAAADPAVPGVNPA